MKFLNKLFSPSSNTIEIYSPMEGTIVPLSKVPDEAIASGAIGDGLAIRPIGNTICAPCDAPEAHFFKTNHAISFEPQGLELIVHFGVDTVKLNGQGFERIGENGRAVKRGDLLMKLNLDYLEKNAASVLSPIIISNMEKVESIKKSSGDVKVGDVLFIVTLK